MAEKKKKVAKPPAKSAAKKVKAKAPAKHRVERQRANPRKAPGFVAKKAPAKVKAKAPAKAPAGRRTNARAAEATKINTARAAKAIDPSARPNFAPRLASPGPHKFRAATAHNKAAMKNAHARAVDAAKNAPDPDRNNPARIQNFAQSGSSFTPGGIIKSIGTATPAQIGQARKNKASGKGGGPEGIGEGGAKRRPGDTRFRSIPGGGRGSGPAPKKAARLTAPPQKPKPTRAAPNLTLALEEDAKPISVVARPQPTALGDSAGNFGGLKRQGTTRRRVPVLDLPPNRRRRGVR